MINNKSKQQLKIRTFSFFNNVFITPIQDVLKLSLTYVNSSGLGNYSAENAQKMQTLSD
jgi:hypothetical protein